MSNMNLDYISGFFDADGSISMGKERSSKPLKALKIDFTNTKKEILLEIQEYLLKEHNLHLAISTKPPKADNHQTSYCLSASSNRTCYKLCQLLNSHHPMKKHRINTVLKYHNAVVKRNGKYNERELARRLAYERLFFLDIF